MAHRVEALSSTKRDGSALKDVRSAVTPNAVL
jgi:hypothetical protein